MRLRADIASAANISFHYKLRVIILKLRVVSLLILLVLATSGLTSAERLKGSGLSDLYKSITYDTNKSRITQCENGLVVEFTALQICDEIGESYLDKYGSNHYWYKAGLLGINHVLGVQGVHLTLTNSTDKIMVVKWSESSLNIGTFNGIPFLAGMKYKDAGNPSATPDTIVPPKQSIPVSLYLSNVSFSAGNWHQGYAYVRVDKSLKAGVHMKVLNASGASTYCSVESPAIILPDSAWQNVKNNKE